MPHLKRRKKVLNKPLPSKVVNVYLMSGELVAQLKLRCNTVTVDNVGKSLGINPQAIMNSRLSSTPLSPTSSAPSVGTADESVPAPMQSEAALSDVTLIYMVQELLRAQVEQSLAFKQVHPVWSRMRCSVCDLPVAMECTSTLQCGVGIDGWRPAAKMFNNPAHIHELRPVLSASVKASWPRAGPLTCIASVPDPRLTSLCHWLTVRTRHESGVTSTCLESTPWVCTGARPFIELATPLVLRKRAPEDDLKRVRDSYRQSCERTMLEVSEEMGSMTFEGVNVWA